MSNRDELLKQLDLWRASKILQLFMLVGIVVSTGSGAIAFDESRIPHQGTRQDYLKANVYFKQARELAAHGFPKESIELINTAISIYPCAAIYHCSLGDCYDALKDYARAIEAYKKATQVAHDYDRAYCGIADVFWKSGNLLEAENAYKTALRVNPHNSTALHHLGELFLQQHKSEETIRCFRKLHDLPHSGSNSKLESEKGLLRASWQWDSNHELLLQENAVEITAQTSGISDIFGRRLDKHGITLVDWDGNMANPAVLSYFVPASNLALPARATLSVSDPRICFSLPSTVNEKGSKKDIQLTTLTPEPFLITSFPQLQNLVQDFTVHVDLTDANGQEKVWNIPIHVLKMAESQEPQEPQFQIPLDFSRDESGFFDDPLKRQIFQQAANNWSYYLADMNLDPVEAGKENTFIWTKQGPPHVASVATNQKSYRGCLVYCYGGNSPNGHPGSEGSAFAALHSYRGKPVSLSRSGGVFMNTAGSYNSLGYSLTTDDLSWFKQNAPGDTGPAELLSIAQHEIGHVIAFYPSFTACANAIKKGLIDEARLVAYYGYPVQITKDAHLHGIFDPESCYGAFGTHSGQFMPFGRILITKLDLMALQAFGYKLRSTAAFREFEFPKQTLLPAVFAKKYSTDLKCSGGIPIYDWTLASGRLPKGLALDPFAGTISGVPVEAGTFNIVVAVRDYHKNGIELRQPINLTVKSREN